MANQRYDVRKEPDGTWTVFDVFTGRPAESVAGTAHLTLAEAADLADILNLLDGAERFFDEEP